MTLEREMTGVEQVDFGVRIVAFEGLRARRQEERIVPAPYREQRRMLRAEVLLEFGIQRDIGLVIAEQIELDLVVAGPGEESGIKGPGIRRQPLRVLLTVRVLPLHRFGLQEGAQGRTVFRRGILPVGLNWIPSLAQALLVGIAVLRDHSGDLLRMTHGKSESHRRAIVKDVNR